MTPDVHTLIAQDLPGQLPRLIYLAFTGYALALVIRRWPATRVMTQDRRFLLLFFLFEIGVVGLTGLARLHGVARVDFASWLTVLLQSFLAAYLHYSIPREFRYPWSRFTRRRR